jgi:hypothetical protein
MQRLQFETTINAPREKVWSALWDDANYREWTSAFSPGSHARTDWAKGSKVLFLDGEGKGGMVSRIADNVPNEYMSIEHLGEMRDGVEDTTSDKVKAWKGAMENYTLKDVDGKTHLTIDTDMADDYVDMMKGMWPKALAKLKEVAERN